MATRKVIINADDLGYDPAVSSGILEAMRQGVVTSATLMVNTPFSEGAAADSSGLSLGLHFNLARFAPVSSTFPSELLNRGELSEVRVGQLRSEAVRDEALAQLDRFEALLGRAPTHVDVHKHLHRHPNVLAGLIAAAQDRKLPVRAIDAAVRTALRSAGLKTTDQFVGDAAIEPYWTLERFRAAIEQLDAGLTELMCHPGHSPTRVASGYAAQREVELATFLSAEAKQILHRSHVQLASFAAL